MFVRQDYMKIILGSASENRQKILREAGYEFEVMVSNIDEKAIRNENYFELPLQVARAKAAALLPKIKESAFLITADTVTVWNGALREKPRNLEEARLFLKTFSESPHPIECINGIVVTNTESGAFQTGVDTSKIWFGKIANELIEALIAERKICNWAGAFTLHDPRIDACVRRIEGSRESVLGLPLELVKKFIHNLS